MSHLFHLRPALAGAFLVLLATAGSSASTLRADPATAAAGILTGRPETPPDHYWSEAPESSADPRAVSAPVRPARYRAYRVELARLRERLRAAPAESPDARAGIEISLPLPDGRIERFRVVESPVLSPELQRAHPDLHTYAGVGSENRLLQARLDDSALGVRALVFAPEGVALLDPLERGRTDRVRVAWASEAEGLPGGAGELVGLEPADLPRPRPRPSGVQAIGDQLKTFRFVFMGVGEYTQALGGVSLALPEMATTLNRVNAIFQRDFAVRLMAVGLMPFPDPATDPYPSSCLGNLDQNQAAADSLFGWRNYDLCQVLEYQATEGYTGVSAVPAVCDSGYKAISEACGHDVTAGNWRFLKVVCHELGHVLGAMHTQDNTCGRWADSAYEPGSGSTIMSYAGKCPPNVQSLADPYYHSTSIEAIVNVWTARPDCGTLTPTGNTPPTVEAGADCTIPRGTPFVLTGGGFDPDPLDTLTYCWEQVDRAPTSADPVLGPLFRTLPPAASPVRALPAFATVLAGTADPWEKLPSVDRTLHFRLTVRDNHPGAGGHAWDERTITVSGEPFVVTFPDGGETFASGEAIPVAWSVGGGGVAPTVNILLSTDGGASWTMLAPNTPNDGAEVVRYYAPATSASCRLRVEAVGNIFYDVTNASFTINGSTTAVPSAAGLPAELALRPAAPNPSVRRTDLGIELPRETELDLAVYTIQGQRVRTLASGRWVAGRHRIAWDGDDDAGRRLSAGVYFVRLAAPEGCRTARVVRLR